MAGTGRLTPSQEVVAEAVERALPDGPLVIALSGGADSAALAWATTALGRGDVRAVSVDHGLPGSRRLMEAAAAIADRLRIDHTIVSVSEVGTSETALRMVRLDALEADLVDGEMILTGHTADDQAETVLGNLVRGAGATGLSGIPTYRAPYCRPLLTVAGATVRRAAADAGLPFVDDPENTDPEIRRNRIRTVTLPHLAEEYNPGVVDALGRAARLIAADDRLIEERAEAVPVRRDEEAVVVAASALATLPTPVAARVVRRLLRIASGPYGGSAADVDAVLSVAATGITASLGDGLLAARERGVVAVYPMGEVMPPDPVPVDPAGTTRFGRWTLRPVGDGYRLGARAARFDPNGAVVRAAVAGDRIALADGGHKTVADAFGEARAPRRLRSRWPVVAVGDTIVWVVGVRAVPEPREGNWFVAMREGA